MEGGANPAKSSDLDRDSEIDRLKQFFIKFDHHIARMR